MIMKLDHIYNQSCGDLSEIPDDSIDLVVTSPPYNISQPRVQKAKKHNITGYGDFTDSMPQDVYEKEQIAILNACCRVIKPGGSIFYNHKARTRDGVEISPHRWIEKSDCVTYQTIIWNRRSTHNLEPSYQRPIHEYIFHLYRPGLKPRVNRDCSEWTSIWPIDWTQNRNNGHPAPFPQELVDRCITLADVPVGGIILDPYMGSSTTAIVAISRGLRYIGYEINADYIRKAQQKIVHARKEWEMFDGADSDTQGGDGMTNPGGSQTHIYKDIFEE